MPSPRRIVRLTATAALLGVGLYLLRMYAGTNEHVVLPGRVYRSAQPSGPRLAELIRDENIRTVLNLRGTAQPVNLPRAGWYRAEAEATHAGGASLEDVTLSAFLLPPPAELRRAIDVLDHAEAPILLHCKQGADRTGLISGVALLLYSDATLNAARRQLWPTYGHFPVGRTVAMDDFFDRYEAWLAGRSHAPALFREWATTVYTPGPAVSKLEWLTPVPARVPADQPLHLRVRATNESADPWEFKPGNYAGIHLAYKVLPNPTTQAYKGQAGLFRRTLPPGEAVDLILPIPPLKVPGPYTVVAEMIDARGCGVPSRSSSFVKFGDEPLLTQFTVE